ncbi:MAG TPA: trimethylamine methyltransferase family protein [Anaerolineales bacterium]|nr:trimethylamine methyltransferase family protein [Anaerolineales bacterium]
MIRPKLDFLNEELIERVLAEAFELLMKPGIKVQSDEAMRLLAEAGAEVDFEQQVAKIPEKVARAALETVPSEFTLYDQSGNPAVHYGGDSVHFDPGSSGVNMYDAETGEHYAAKTEDLVNIIKLTDMLPQYDAQSTAVVCSEIPKDIGDLYRLYLVMRYSAKPVVTGAFSTKSTDVMIKMLSIFAGGRDGLAEKPTAVFDVCPSPPLIWSNFGSQNLMDLARAGVPAEIVSMPLAGAAAPVTLIGSVVQHAAECISGMTIHQLAKSGSPIVWGGAPAIMDMRYGTTPMGAIETAMIDASYAQVGKYLGFPTHAYMGASDSKMIDAQAGMESGMTALVGALAGINMISGAGMLDFLVSQSLEKLVIDAEMIGMCKRLVEGVKVHTETLATAMFEDIHFKGEFLKQRVTRQLVKKEQYIPSSVLDRGSVRAWKQDGQKDAAARAGERVAALLSGYEPPQTDAGKVKEVVSLVENLAKDAGMETLPKLDLV